MAHLTFMEKNLLLDTLIDKTLQYLTELKETSSHVIGSCDPLCQEGFSTFERPPELIDKEVTHVPTVLPVPAPKSTPAPLLLEPKPLELAPIEPIQLEPLPLVPTPIVQSSTTNKEKTSTFTLHPPSPIQKDTMQDMRAIIKKAAPSLTLFSSPPSDEKAKKIKNAWKEQSKIPDIPILATKGPSLPFLTHVAKAIELHFFPSKVIDVTTLEQNNSWDVFLNTTNLKMIIAPDSVVWSCKNLMRYYHEFPNKKERYLGKIPLILLPDPSLYTKDPSLKRPLWNLLCQVLKPLQS
jgi:hypothetical protein